VPYSDGSFSGRVLAGSFFRDIVWQLLEDSGYTVLPYGYEVTVPYVRQRLGIGSSKSKVMDRFRSSPDLLVIDEAKDELNLVEVKWRNWNRPYVDSEFLQLSKYKKYWPEAVLVLLVPSGYYFYAQRVSKLKPGRGHYRLATSFKRIDRFFPKITKASTKNFQSAIDLYVGAYFSR
jgi:hypothetical protein